MGRFDYTLKLCNAFMSFICDFNGNRLEAIRKKEYIYNFVFCILAIKYITIFFIPYIYKFLV